MEMKIANEQGSYSRALGALLRDERANRTLSAAFEPTHAGCESAHPATVTDPPGSNPPT